MMQDTQTKEETTQMLVSWSHMEMFSSGHNLTPGPVSIGWAFTVIYTGGVRNVS